MAILQFLIQLAGAVVLLLFAVRMVRTGVERLLGPRLQRALLTSRGMPTLMGSGLFMALILQSSAAVALLVAGFAGSGAIGFAPGLAIVLGADLGSALLILVLSFPLESLIPALLIVGGLLFLKARTNSWRQAGRALVGIALILVSLRFLREAIDPLRTSAILPAVAGYLAEDFLTAFLAGAALAFLMMSSVATILMTVAVVGLGALPPEAGVSLVLGANLGSALIPVWLTRGADTETRRIPLANLALRGAAALITAAILDRTGLPDTSLLGGAAMTLIAVHIAFNACVLVLVVLAPWLEGMLHRVLPAPAGPGPANPLHKSHLDPRTTDTPVRALASMRREVIRMVDVASEMLAPAMELYRAYDPERARALAEEDKVLNTALDDIRRFAADMPHAEMQKSEKRELRALLDYAIAMEAVGDIVTKRVVSLAREKSDNGLRFSAEGYAELEAMRVRLCQNIRTAASVLLSGDVEGARHLIEEKAEMARLERKTRKEHLKRLRAGVADSVASSDVHIETAYTLKEMHSWVVTVAHPILVREGQLLDSRLAEDAGDG